MLCQGQVYRWCSATPCQPPPRPTRPTRPTPGHFGSPSAAGEPMGTTMGPMERPRQRPLKLGRSHYPSSLTNVSQEWEDPPPLPTNLVTSGLNWASLSVPVGCCLAPTALSVLPQLTLTRPGWAQPPQTDCRPGRPYLRAGCTGRALPEHTSRDAESSLHVRKPVPISVTQPLVRRRGWLLWSRASPPPASSSG